MSDLSPIYLTIVGPESAIQALAGQQLEGVTLGEAQPLDGLADAVDAPLGPEEMKLLLEFLTASLSAGAAALTFIQAILLILKRSEKPPAPAPVQQIVILDGRSSNVIVRIDENSDAVKALEQLNNWKPDGR